MGFEPIFPDLSAGIWTGKNEYELAQTAKRFEVWERNYSLILGARAAVEYALDLGLENIQKRVQFLANYTREGIGSIPDWRVLDKGKNLCGIVTAHRENCDLNHLKQAFVNQNINVSFASKTNAFIDMDEKGVDWTLRIAPHYYNLESEIDKAIKVMPTKSWI
jgi:selenocysteine lyase/cysteine desulfurase